MTHLPKLLAALSVALVCQVAYSQAPLEPCFPAGPISINAGSGTIDAYCIETTPAPGPTPSLVVDGTRNLQLQGEMSVTLKEGFKAGPFTTGSFGATTTANKTAAAVMAPKDYDGTVCMFNKFELGLQLHDSINALVDSFITNGAGGLNPFNPEHINITAVFSHATAQPQAGFGFYMQHFALADSDGDNKIDTMPPAATNFQWRLRHAFTHAGNWHVNVTMQVLNGPATELADFDLTATDCGKPGYLIVGHDGTRGDRYMRFSQSGEAFFALGYSMNRDRANYAEYTDAGTIDFYETILSAMSGAGGNYTRVWCDPGAFGVESEQLGNYATSNYLTDNGAGFGYPWLTRQQKAGQLDALLELADSLGVYLHLCLEVAGFWDPHEPGVTRLHERWEGHPYTAIPGVNEPIDFFTNTSAQTYYKRKLRYVIARWGYSTAIACWEFFNEVDGIAHGTFFDRDSTAKSIRLGVRDWHHIMSEYIKLELGDWRHPLTTSFAGYANFGKTNQMPWTLPYIDLVQYHKYTQDENCSRDRFNTVRPYVNHDFTSSSYQAPSNPWYKPAMLSEAGALWGMDTCDSKALHDMLWSSAFSGTMGVALNWDGQYTHQMGDFVELAPLKSFLDDVDWIGGEWKPHKWVKRSKAANPFELYNLTSGDNKRAIGWVANRTYNWANLEDSVPCIHSYVFGPLFLRGEAVRNNLEMRPISNKKATIKGLIPFHSYTIEWYAPHTGVHHATATHTANQQGRLKVDVPLTNGHQPDWAFKVFRSNLSNFKFSESSEAITEQALEPEQALNKESDEDLAVFPNPTMGNTTISNLTTFDSLDVFDLYGNCVNRIALLGKTAQIELTLPYRGIFFIVAKSGERTSVAKVIAL